ncbi:MAG: hypothetical protein ACYC9Z_04255 [Casimicrobiaceae bacterium]
MAAKANTMHGLRLDAKAARMSFRMFIHGRGHRRTDGTAKTYREIASELGGARTYQTVFRWMKADFPKIAKALGDPFKGRPRSALRPAENLHRKLQDDPVLSVINAGRGIPGYDPETRRALIEAALGVVQEARRYEVAPEGEF